MPRTLYSSLYNEEGTIEDALKSISPLHLVEKMPKIKYHIFHCDEDRAVNIDAHSNKFVSALKEKNYDVTLDIIEGRGHCDLTLEMKRKFAEYVIAAIES